METTVSKVYAALPGTIEQIVSRSGVDRQKARKSLHNMQSRGQIKRNGAKGASVWSVRKGGPSPKHVRHKESPQKRAWKTRKKQKAKRRYTKRKNKHPALLVYLETLEARIAKLEQIIGV